MEAKDVKPGRPSLLSATDRNATPPAPSARILAGMETGNRTAYPVARRPHRLSWILGGSVIVLLAGYYVMTLPAKDDSDAASAVSGSADVASVTGVAEAAAVAGPNVEAMPAPFDSLATQAEEPAEFPLPPLGDTTPPPVKATKTTKKSSTAPASKAATGQRAARAPARREPPLMASLLKNIEQEPVAANAARKPQPQPQPESAPEPVAPIATAPVAHPRSAMDQLVQRIDSGDAVASVGSGGTHTQTVQAALRKCPRANTRAGLRCREKICSRFRGLDRACPD